MLKNFGIDTHIEVENKEMVLKGESYFKKSENAKFNNKALLTMRCPALYRCVCTLCLGVGGDAWAIMFIYCADISL